MANRTDTQSVINLVINGKQAMTSLKELTDTQRRLNTEMRNMKPNDPGYRERLKEVKAVNKALEEQKKEIKGINNESETFKLNFKSLATGLAIGAGAAALASIPAILGKIKDAYAEAEKNRAVLTNAFNGDSKKASDSLKMLMDYAAKTPFSMQEATEGFIKLVNRGIVPTQAEMVKLGDIAASQGKGLDQLIEAIMDSQTGENERLKEFGIRAAKNGDMVSFSFKGVTKEVKNTEEAIKEAILSFGEMKGVSGTMETVSKTIVGLQSNIGDTWDQIFTKMGQKSEGFINGFYNLYGSALDYINDNLLGTETAAQKLTAEFNNQASEVRNLEKNVSPLLDRYDELQRKGKLNANEQNELKSVIQQVAATIPSAVTQWNSLNEAMGLNTAKARESIEIQKALMRNTNKDALEGARKELALYIKMRDGYLKTLNKGETKTIAQGGYVFTKKNDDQDIAELRAGIDKYNKLINERDLLIKGLSGNYLDEKVNKATNNPINKARTEGVIGKEIEALKNLRKEQDIHSKSYSDYTKKIAKLEDELKGSREKGSSSQKKRSDQQVKQLEKEHDKLKEVAQQMQTDFNIKDSSGLEKKLLEIAKKYDPLIEKAKKFKDEALAGILTDLKEKETTRSGEEMDKESTLAINKSNDSAFKDGLEWLDKDFQTEKNGINSEYADGLSSFDNEFDKLALQEEAQQKERELIESHLIAKKLLYETYGKDATDLDSQLTKIRIENAEREAQGKIAATQAKKDIESAYMESAASATQFLMGLVNKQSIAYKGLIVAEKALSISKIIMNTQAEISGYYAKYSLVPGGVLIASGLAAAAKVRSGISIGLVAAAGIAELAQSGGKKTQEGDAHAKGVRNVQGGTAFIGEAGPELVESDGKWWIAAEPQLADLPRGANVYNTSDTVNMLKNKSLGEQIYPQNSYTIDSKTVQNAERSYRSTGQVPSFSPGSTTNPNISDASRSANNISTALMEEKMDLLIKAVSKGLVFDYKGFEEYRDKIDYTREQQSG